MQRYQDAHQAEFLQRDPMFVGMMQRDQDAQQSDGNELAWRRAMRAPAPRTHDERSADATFRAHWQQQSIAMSQASSSIHPQLNDGHDSGTTAHTGQSSMLEVPQDEAFADAGVARRLREHRQVFDERAQQARDEHLAGRNDRLAAATQPGPRSMPTSSGASSTPSAEAGEASVKPPKIEHKWWKAWLTWVVQLFHRKP
ncbi:hypothetical protein LTR85_011028 [Meristemomyces frigidus]|nr:hypothetical protein LTR85_011028 [Meristemomyces frigidus]